MSVIKTAKALIASKDLPGDTGPFYSDKLLAVAKYNKDITDNNDSRITDLVQVIPGQIVEKRVFEDIFNSSKKDFETISTAQGLLAQKNSSYMSEIVVKQNEIKSLIGKLYATVDAAMLCSDINNSRRVVLSESFSSKSDILPDSTLDLNIDEGIITLPVKTVENIDLKSAKITLGSLCNGTFVTGIDKAFDGDMGTFCEYTTSMSSDKLILDLSIDLGKSEIINNIVIEPNDYGLKNYIKIDDLSVSLDGINYRSVFERSEIADMFFKASSTSEEFVELVPDVSNNATKFSYTFIPTSVRYVRVVFSQRSIDVLNEDLRISLREFSFNNVTYKESGTLTVSKKIQPTLISSMQIESDKNLTDNSLLFDVLYAVRFNDGVWYNIKEDDILNINKPWTTNNAQIDGYIEKIDIKISIQNKIPSLNDDEFSSKTETPTSEFIKIPSSDPFKINLSKQPIKNSVKLFTSPHIVVGDEFTKGLVLGKTDSSISAYKFSVPFNIVGDVTIFAGANKLSKYDSIGDMNAGASEGFVILDKDIYLNLDSELLLRNENISIEPWLQNSDPLRSIVADESSARDYSSKDIKMFMESPLLECKELVIQLPNYTDGVQQNTSVYKVTMNNGVPASKSVTDYISKGISTMKLSAKPKQGTVNPIVGGYEVTFVDGVSEFDGCDIGAFSIDYINNQLYMAYPYDDIVTITYSTDEIEKLNQDDFTIHSDFDKIVLSEYVADPNARYMVNYNVTVPLESDEYSVSGQQAVFSGKFVSRLLNKFTDYNGKYVLAAYKYYDNIAKYSKTVADMISPIISKIDIEYTKEI